MDIANATKLPLVSEDEVYADIRRTYPTYPVGFNPLIAMQMLRECRERLTRARRPNPHLSTNPIPKGE